MNDILKCLIAVGAIIVLFGGLTLFVLFMEWQDKREEARKKCGNCIHMTICKLSVEKDKYVIIGGNCYFWDKNSCSIIWVHSRDKCYYNPSRFQLVKRPNIFKRIFDKLIAFIPKLFKEYKKLLGV